jgi:hypothetical protein
MALLLHANLYDIILQRYLTGIVYITWGKDSPYLLLAGFLDLLPLPFLVGVVA